LKTTTTTTTTSLPFLLIPTMSTVPVSRVTAIKPHVVLMHPAWAECASKTIYSDQCVPVGNAVSDTAETHLAPVETAIRLQQLRRPVMDQTASVTKSKHKHSYPIQIQCHPILNHSVPVNMDILEISVSIPLLESASSMNWVTTNYYMKSACNWVVYARLTLEIGFVPMEEPVEI